MLSKLTTRGTVGDRVSDIETGNVALNTAVGEVASGQQSVQDAQLISAIVGYSDDALIGSTLEGVIMSWNPAAERMYGYTRQEIIGRCGSVLTPAHRAGEFLAIVTMVKDGRAAQHVETTRVRKNGAVFPVSLTVAPIHDEAGAIIGASSVHRDVTEQRHAFEVAQRMEAIVRDSEDAIIGRTLGGIITSWNPAAERMFGYTGEEIIGTSIAPLIPDDRMAESAAIVVKVGQGQHVERIETTRVRKSGAVFPASVTISPIRNMNGEIVGASAVIRDVTEQRHAFEVAQRMEAIVASSDDAIIAITLEGTVTSWNPAAEKLFGYTGEEIIGRSAETVTPKDRPEEMTTILAKVGAGWNIDHLETIRVRKDGTAFPVSLTVSPIRDPDGSIVGSSMISRNMTELRHAARYARSLIEAALDPMATISPDGKITDVNRATEKVTGVARDELIGTDFSHYFTDPEMAHEAYTRVFAHGSLTDYPLILVHRNGTLFDVLYNASVYRDFNGVVLGVLAVARDASQLREQQQLSQQLQVALTSRVVIEQAKGITAQQHGVTIDAAYQLIRAHARNQNTSLHRVAEAIVAVGLRV